MAPLRSELSPLNLPAAILVDVSPDGAPAAVGWKGQTHCVAGVLDTWRIDDGWWRTGISRQYYRLILENGHLLEVFHDLLSGNWFRQRY